MVTASVASSSIRTKGCSRLLKRAAGLGALIAVCGAGMPQASAQFVKLADFDTFVPGGSFLEYTSGLFPAGTDKFNGFGAPAIFANSVVFHANSSGILAPLQVAGLFRAPANGGAVAELVTRRTWLPEYTAKSGLTAPNNAGEGVFLDFSSWEVKGGRVTFAATTVPTAGTLETRVYAVDVAGSNLQYLLRAKDPRSPSGTYEPISNVLGASDRAVIHAGNPAGLYQRGAAGSQTIVDSTTLIPGTVTNFFVSNVVEHVAYEGGVSFVAQSPIAGNAIWRKNDTDTDFVLLRQSNFGALPPGEPFRILSFHQLRADAAGALTFLGSTAGATQTGIFTQRTSTDLLRQEFATIATTSMAAASGVGNYKTFTRIASSSMQQIVAGSGRRYLEVDVAFTATDATNKNAIYAYIDDQVSSSSSARYVQRVIGVGDTLDGKKIAQVEIGRNGISNGTVAFSARFEDSTQAIYTVPVAQLVPRSGVTVRTEARPELLLFSFQEPNVVSGETFARSFSTANRLPTDLSGVSTASGEGLASPLTGSVRVRAYAFANQSAGRTEVVATQRFIVLGERDGDIVDVDFNFSFSGVLGVALGSTEPSRAGVDIQAYVYQPGSRVDLFKGDLELSHHGLDRNGAFREPEAINDAVGYLDPFGDGRDAVGIFVDAEREFPDAVTARVGETLAVQYVLGVYAAASLRNLAVSDFSRTFDAFASTDTLGASLAMIYAAPVPEPEQVLLMLCGLALLFARLRKAQRKT